jgi:AraC-like DNA-binding protein
MYGLAYFALQQTVVYSSELRQLLAEPITAAPLKQATQKLLRPTSFQAQRLLLQSPMLRQPILPGEARNDAASATSVSMNTTKTENLPEIEPAVAEYIAQLKGYMEDHKPYLDNQLNLQKLSELSGIPAYKISELLNQHIGYNFFDFVNRHRVEEWKRLVREHPTAATIQELAFQVGFNSKSSFNAAFKKHTGQTPSEYRAGLV